MEQGEGLPSSGAEESLHSTMKTYPKSILKAFRKINFQETLNKSGRPVKIQSCEKMCDGQDVQLTGL